MAAHQHVSAVALEPVTLGKSDDGPTVTSGGPSEGQREEDSHDCAAHHQPQQLSDLDADRKQYLTLQARAALAGFELVGMGDGTFRVSRWGMFRPLADEAACEAFLARVGAPR